MYNGEEQCGLFNKRCWGKVDRYLQKDENWATVVPLLQKPDSQWSEVLSDRPETIGTPRRKQRVNFFELSY